MSSLNLQVDSSYIFPLGYIINLHEKVFILLSRSELIYLSMNLIGRFRFPIFGKKNCNWELVPECQYFAGEKRIVSSFVIVTIAIEIHFTHVTSSSVKMTIYFNYWKNAKWFTEFQKIFIYKVKYYVQYKINYIYSTVK